MSDEESGRPSWAVLGPGRPSEDWMARRVEEEPARRDVESNEESS